MAHYYLGNLLYDKKRHRDAIRHWEASREANNSFATVHRNLALAYYNALGRPAQALNSLEKAFACNLADARVFYELDQLYKKVDYAPEKRLASLEGHWELVTARDDTRDFLLRLRSSPPVRRVQGRLLNVCGTYASRKMGVSIQFESHTVELWAI